jgi:hypothetical protein
MIIASLPSPDHLDLMRRMISHPLVGGVRFNTGMRNSWSPRDTLECIYGMIRMERKELWIDIKGRQLRINQWADPTYGDIVLNREITVDLPAKIFFRGAGWTNIVRVKGNRIYVDPDPPVAIGGGQSVNVAGRNLHILGPYLTSLDVEYIKVGAELGINELMLSFIEKTDDIDHVLSINKAARVWLKIESEPGISFMKDTGIQFNDSCRLMAARDDMLTNLENKSQIIPILETMIRKDPEAIAASHILSSVTEGQLSAADISDLKLLSMMGYKHFMLGDLVSLRYFDEAMEILQDFQC